MLVANSAEKTSLAHYNSAFLLPGFFLSSALGILNALSLVSRSAMSSKRTYQVLIGSCVVCCFAAYGYLFFNIHKVPGSPLRLQSSKETRQLDVSLAIRTCLADYPGVRSLATDFFSITLVPNRIRKYLLRHYSQADAVLLFSDASHLYSGYDAIGQLLKRLSDDDDYVPARDRGEFSLFIKKTLIEAQNVHLQD